MRIAVNTRLLLPNKLEGIGWFTYQTIKIIVQNNPQHTFLFFFDRPYDAQFVFSENIIPVVLFPPSRHPVLWYWWFEFSIKKALKKYKADVFLSPDGYVCLGTKTPTIAVIHDINFVHRPQDLPFTVRTYYNYFFPKFAKRANKIATVSEYTKKDLVETYNIPPEKIKVVYNGSHERYIPLNEPKINETRNKYTSGKPYFLFVGALHPRKNIVRLLLAFERFKEVSQSQMNLVIVGEAMFMAKDIELTFKKMKYKEDVVFTGRLSTVELHHVLASAYALTFVPLFEGFGIPILEAMNCDIPVISGNLTSLPEVAGDAAIYVNPYYTEEIANAMVSISSDELLRLSLIEKARIQRQKFSWQKTAELLWSEITQLSA